VLLSLGVDRFHRPEDRLRLHHHARTAAKRHVVHRAMPVGCVVAQIARLHLDQAILSRAPDDAIGERGLDHAREDRDDVDDHVVPSFFPGASTESKPSIGATAIVLPGTSTDVRNESTIGIRISPVPSPLTTKSGVAPSSTRTTRPTIRPAAVTSHPIKS